MRKLRESLPQGYGELGAALGRVETAMVEMMTEADLIFRYFESGESAKAAQRMATMDRKYGVLTREVNKSAELIQDIQSKHFAAQLAEARKLRRFEYLIGALILLMVGFVAIYGHKIGGLFQKQYDELSSANAMLEERTAKLQEANKYINSLNAELASTIVQLREAQAELIRQKDELTLQNARFNAALRHLPVGLSMFDSEQRLIVCNNAYGETYDLPLALRQPGTHLADLVRYYVKSETGGDRSRSVSDWIAQHYAKVANGQLFTDIQNLSDGRAICVRVGPTAEGGWVDVMEDVTEQHPREAQIAHLARHDSLTNLPNRLLLREQLEQALKSVPWGEKLAMLYLDLDRFKEVNDTLGHPTGDALLKTVAERLRNCVRETDVIARLGGDEFVVLHISADPLTEAAALASRLMEVISEPYDVNGRQAVIGTSIGIAIAPDDGADPDMLLAQADMALYHSKDDGRGTYCFFEQEMNTRAHARRHLEHDFRLALASGELELNYQPFVNLELNEVSGFEALLRWRHPQRGTVSPGDFIPLAEETGLIVAIGEWVLREACAEAANWLARIRVSVNVSPVQFKSRKLAETVINALAASGLAAHRLELEITESVLLQDSDATLATLRQLHDFGVRISMDDFGTGYSSLSYLHKFPIDRIKIDRCFIASLSTGEEHTLAIVREISSLGRTLGLGITAEGVETQHQLGMVRLEGCDEMQGYIYSPARPAAEIRRQFLTRADGRTSEGKTVAA